MANILASGISNHEHLAAFDEMVAERLSGIDVEAVLIYLIDTVNASALPILAEQFDILGIKGFGLVQTEDEQREVIKKAIELHRFKGTPWSIKEALRAIGYFDAEIIEGFSDDIIFYNGVHNHNGTQLYGPGHWADFAVIMDIGATQGINAQSAAAAVALIMEYKNLRSRLRYVAYQATINEIVTGVTESLDINIIMAFNDYAAYYHDSVFQYNGSINHGVVSESLNLNVVGSQQPVPPNFWTFADWGALGVTDEATFIAWVEANSDYTVNNVFQFSLVGTELKCNIEASGGTLLGFTSQGFTEIKAIGNGFDGLEILGFNLNSLTTFNLILPLPTSVIQIRLTNINISNWDLLLPWITAQPAFTNPCTILTVGNPTSAVGTAFETIALTKNAIIVE